MRIQKYSVGGINYIPVSGVAAGQTPAASTTSSSDSKVPGFTKEIIDLVKENGLESDVNQFLNGLEHTLQLAADPTGEHLSMKDILKVTKEANKVKRNMELYNDAKSVLKDQQSWGEVATTERGALYVLNKKDNKVDTISAEEFDKNRDDYTLLTNADLLNYRSQNISTAFNQTMLNDVSQSIGTTTIAKYVQDLVAKLGKSTLEQYTQKQQGQIQRGLEKLLQYGPDGVYSIKSTTPIQDQDIDFVLRTLRDALPNQYRNALEAKAVAEGLKPGEGYRLLGEIAVADAVRETTADYMKDMSLAAGYSTGSADDPKLQAHDDYLVRISSGQYGPARPVSIIAKGANPRDNARMNTVGYDVGPVIDHNKKTLETTSVANMLTEAWGLQAADTSSITFGNRHIENSELSSLMWTNNEHLYVVELPATKDEHGNVVPNFTFMENIDKINQYVKDNPNLTSLELNQYKQKLFGNDAENVRYENGKFVYIGQDSIPFITFKAYAGKDTLSLSDQDKNFLEKVPKDQGSYLVETYNNLFKYGKLSPAKNSSIISKGHKSERNDFYAGNVYVPITTPWAGFNVSTINQYHSKEDFTNVEQKMVLREAAIARSQQNPLISNW